MPVLKADYKPNYLFRHRHLNTIYPYLARPKVQLPFVRTRYDTDDGDFVDVDFIRTGSRSVAILCHGLEGSYESQYIQHTARLLSSHTIDVAALNYRSCSGEMNKTATMYHSGFTRDLHMLIGEIRDDYDEIHLVGFSLGGNMVLKYTSDEELPLDSKIRSVVAQSVPCDLSGSSHEITSWYNKVYDRRFLATLKDKMRAKQRQFPGLISKDSIDLVKNLVDFDEYFTGPLHGFTGAEDYYSKCSSLQFMPDIHLPTLLVSALDDPFLSKDCFPFDIANENKNLVFKAPKFGGHLGFTTFGQSNYWNEFEILNFINK